MGGQALLTPSGTSETLPVRQRRTPITLGDISLEDGGDALPPMEGEQEGCLRPTFTHTAHTAPRTTPTHAPHTRGLIPMDSRGAFEKALHGTLQLVSLPHTWRNKQAFAGQWGRHTLPTTFPPHPLPHPHTHTHPTAHLACPPTPPPPPHPLPPPPRSNTRTCHPHPQDIVGQDKCPTCAGTNCTAPVSYGMAACALPPFMPHSLIWLPSVRAHMLRTVPGRLWTFMLLGCCALYHAAAAAWLGTCHGLHCFLCTQGQNQGFNLLLPFSSTPHTHPAFFPSRLHCIAHAHTSHRCALTPHTCCT